ncbi:MAG: hypothetical protein NVSMB17_08250 [Candidatus Dormibacteria bacterium]
MANIKPRGSNVAGALAGLALVAALLSACGGAAQGTTTPVAAGNIGSAAPAGNTGSAAPAATSANGTPAVKGAGASNPCSLLPRPDVEAAFGYPIDEPRVESKHGRPFCNYGHGADLDLLVAVTSTTMTREGFDHMKSLYGGATDVPDSGGDAAFEFSRNYSVLKGANLLQISTGVGPAIISDDKLRGLIRTAVSHL